MLEADDQASWGKGCCNVVGHPDSVLNVNHACYTLVVESHSFLVFAIVHNDEKGFDGHHFERKLEDHMGIFAQVDMTPKHWQAQILVTIKVEKIDLAHVDLLEAQIYRVTTYCTDLGSYVHIEIHVPSGICAGAVGSMISIT